MKILNIEQGTKEWLDARRSMITGTKLDDVNGTALAQVQLVCELIAEEATEQTKMIRATDEMERGNAEEEFAVKLFEEVHGKELVRGGMWLSDEYDYLACSPDAYIVDASGDVLEAVEVKNPDSKTVIFDRLVNLVSHDELGLTKSKIPFLGIPAQYKYQCLNYFLVNRKLQKLHFVIHDARFIDPKAKLTVVTLNRENEVLQDALAATEQALIAFRAKWLEWKEIVLPDNF